MKDKSEAHLIILTETDAEQMMDQSYGLFSLLGDLLHRRRIALLAPTDDLAKVLPIRKSRAAVEPCLDEVF